MTMGIDYSELASALENRPQRCAIRSKPRRMLGRVIADSLNAESGHRQACPTPYPHSLFSPVPHLTLSLNLITLSCVVNPAKETGSKFGTWTMPHCNVFLPFLLWVGLTAAVVAPRQAVASPAYPPLPEAVSSFGATVLGQHLYIFGGHMGRVPGNSKDGLSPHFARLDLTSPAAGWEELPMLETSQSPGLVAWNGAIYRVGGLSFRNAAGEPTDYNSLSIFAKFAPQTKTWKELPPLPEPRSSLDAAVVDGKLYVVGGWNLQAGNVQEAPWHEDALVFDLADEQGQWKPIAKPPFQTRALAAAPYRQQLYVLGGMKSNNQTTNEVYVYDPASDAWTTGPELAGGGTFSGFALAAFGANDRLYLSGGSGTVYQLNAAADGWEPLERLFFSRMFHRLVVGPEGEVIVLGGVGGRTYLANLEAVIPGRTSAMKQLSWDVEFPGKARHSQALALHGSKLYAFGGNTSTAPHDFKAENFSNEAFEFDLTSRTVATLEPLPQPMQSGAAFVAGTRIDPSIYVVGGLAPRAEGFGPTDVIQQYRLRSKAWSVDEARLPEPWSMFELAVHDHTAWIFGGSVGRELAKSTMSWKPSEDSAPHVVDNAAIPEPRRSFAGAVLGNKYYAVGGLGEGTAIVGKAYVFDFEFHTWSEIAAPQHARVFAQLAVAGGKVYLAGGFSRVDGHFASTTAIEVYDPDKNVWTSTLEEFAPQLSKMRVLGYDDRLLFYSVDPDKEGLAHFVLVDPAPQTQGYGVQEPLPEARSAGQDLLAQLNSLDKNGDGNVALEEVGRRFQALVKRADADRDGIATKAEIEAFIKQIDDENASQSTERGGADAGGRTGSGRPPGSAGRGDIGNLAERVDRIFAGNDADKDGLLKGDEIPERMRNGLDRSDTNRDGALSREEIEAMFRSFGRRREDEPSRETGTGNASPRPARVQE